MPYKILQNPVLSGHNHCHFVCSLRGDFNPLSPCGERRKSINILPAVTLFQPTLPVWGETSSGDNTITTNFKFQPTLPVWGETTWFYRSREDLTISTHSPRVGRDTMKKKTSIMLTISTHSPRVGRDGLLMINEATEM